MNSHIILFFILLASSSAFPKISKYRSKPRIAGGEEAVPNSIPYQVLVTAWSANSAWFCGGVLISENYVLTLGFCADGARRITLLLGAHNHTAAEETQLELTSEEILIHQDFDIDQLLNDIALIKLPEPVNFTNAIQPVNLPSRDDVNNTFERAEAIVSGWGLTNTIDEERPDSLLVANLWVISNEDCGLIYDYLNDGVLCASGNRTSGVCDGDYGGPLVTNDTLIGLALFSAAGNCREYPSGFVRITAYLDWIEKNSDVVVE